MPTTYCLTRSEFVTVREHSPDALVVEVEYSPQGSPPPPHFHPSQYERFEVIVGALRAVVDGKVHTLHAGDVLDVPQGAVHQLWNPGDTPTHATWSTRPAGRTREWFAALDSTQREGRAGRKGIPGPLALAVLLTAYRDTIRLARRPRFLVGAALGALAAVGRLRGHRPPAPPRPTPVRAV
ncbi:cupin domain-containing protein [Pyxidicoccus caerfyrddinensis]|jgi:quercetin dioxygenase-like cupin family protein|uniref:cupin domain-containing protein n=1 Tax=Pyxidicoccus caerfyrddinensis TaxID=2709663 RepID=UPI0013D97EDC|nr:cupin domain-containing protein [Pyxidicoccus caerfyrddinensis]